VRNLPGALSHVYPIARRQSPFKALRARRRRDRPLSARLAAPWAKNWAITLPREAGWSICGVEIGEAKRKFRLSSYRRRFFQTILSELKETFHEKSMLAQLGS